MPLGNNLPLSSIPGFQWTAGKPLLPFDLPLVGTVGELHADTILLSWACMAVILGGALMVRPMLIASGPGSNVQAIVEGLHEFTAGIAREQIHGPWKKFFPLIASIFIFVLIANLSGILPWQWIAEHIPGWPPVIENGHVVMENGKAKLFEMAAPSTDFNVTFGLALVAIVTYLGSGFWAHGGKYLKHYLNPIEWLDLLIRPATLAIRLMMVITADEILRGASLMLVPVLVPTGVMGFEMFIALIQAFVFALLTAIYIGLTVAHH